MKLGVSLCSCIGGSRAKSFAILREPCLLIECDIFELKEVYIRFDLSLRDCFLPLYIYEISLSQPAEIGRRKGTSCIDERSFFRLCKIYYIPLKYATRKESRSTGDGGRGVEIRTSI